MNRRIIHICEIDIISNIKILDNLNPILNNRNNITNNINFSGIVKC